MIRVTIWNEYYHELTDGMTIKMYPGGIHEFLKEQLRDEEFEIKTAWLEKDEFNGLSDEVLDNTDVLMWWGHCRHAFVDNDTAERVFRHVIGGMGFIAMHSAHLSKPFRRLMGTSCKLQWRCDNERARVWCTKPAHPIAQGIPMSFELEAEEMYGEYFDIPTPDELLFVTWFQGGEIFRGGCTWTRGQGRIFYFHPGHELCPSFHNPYVIRILKNAIRWVNKTDTHFLNSGEYKEPDEKFDVLTDEECIEKFAPKG